MPRELLRSGASSTPMSFANRNMLGALIRGAVGARPKRSANTLGYLLGGSRGSFLNASTLLAAAGMAWGMLDTFQGERRARVEEGTAWEPTPRAPGPRAPGEAGAPDSIGGSSVTGAPDSSVASSASTDKPEVLRIVRLSVSAARADGRLSTLEREKLLAEARTAGLEELVRAELERPAALSAIVADVADERQRRELYALAFAIVRADEGVSGAERVYLAQLAYHLDLDAAAAGAIEAETAARIDGAARA